MVYTLKNENLTVLISDKGAEIISVKSSDGCEYIWQGDANAYALLALELADSPRKILNVTGPELESTEKTAVEMGKLLGKEVTFVSEKAGDLNYLNDASQMIRLFGNPRYTLGEMIEMQAQWIKNGGISIGKPTHFEVSNGKF